MVEKEEAVISEEEAAQYDRQIRLWGLEAQKRLRTSRVLLVGMRGLGAEVAKNLILAGVKALTLLDHEQVSSEDSRAQFLIPSGSLGQNRAEASLNRARNLNPMVSVEADTENINQKSDDFFTQFDVVCLTSCSRDLLVRVDHICHKHNIKFFTGDVFGYHGYMFADLGEHEFVEEKAKVAKVSKAKQEVEDGPEAKKAKIDPTESILVKKKVQFCPLKDALEIDWHSEKAKSALKKTPTDFFLLQDLTVSGRNRSKKKCVKELHCFFIRQVLMKFRTDKKRDPQPSNYQEDSELLLQICSDVLDSLGVSPDLLPKDFASYCFSEMAPVCAVVGGVLGQEIVKALSQRDAPHNNFFFFDGRSSNGIVDCLGSK
ncbi:SUMO-activating enzyme subunit 1 isoform X1 [Xenopus tropicalis]|uniref:SUMO-activating enzyme subunit 1 n=1 Tax=Xenopus tropicalis TaxID=8364 RepID=A0A8J1ILH5_XENTR|nr:SUMO-activating enzyme subunit 1 isoform X1 [Xenopus tropicalis]